MKNIPRIRFPEFNDIYSEKKLSYYLSEQKERNKKLKYTKSDVLSISGEKGVINQIQHIGKSLSGENLSNYMIVYPLNIVYNKSILKENPYGTIKCNLGAIGIVSPQYAVYSCNNINILNPKYLEYYFSLKERLSKFLKPLINEGARCRSVQIINRDLLRGTVYLPTIEEQNKIVNFFTVYDQNIQNQTIKINILEKRKTGYLQKILSQEIKFKTDLQNNLFIFNENHDNNKLSSYLFVKKNKNKNNVYTKKDILSASEKYGIVYRSSIPKKSKIGDNFSNYNIVQSKDIVYTKSHLKESPYGIIKCNLGDTGIISPMYAVYGCYENVNPTYIEYYFSLKNNLNKYLEPLVNFGARCNSVNINNEDMLNGIVNFPTLKEQEKIVSFFKLIDQQIQVEKEKLESMKFLKKGLLQQMFV